MAYHRKGDRIKADFLDINGEVIMKYDSICFGRFFSVYTGMFKLDKTLIRIYLHYSALDKHMKYYLEQLKLMGFFKNIKCDVSNKVVTLSLNPNLVTAQEMFWVSTCVRICCFNSGVLRNFYDLHQNTGFDAGKLILLSHFFNIGRNRSFTSNGYSDHTLIGGYSPTIIRNGVNQLLDKIRTSGFPNLRNATSYSFMAGYQNFIRGEFNYNIARRGQQVFSDVSQFKEFLCQD